MEYFPNLESVLLNALKKGESLVIGFYISDEGFSNCLEGVVRQILLDHFKLDA